MSPPGVAQFNIQIGDELTSNVEPLLHQVRHALEQLLNNGETTIIDLRSIPLAPAEESVIVDTLARGEVHARLNALGPSEIIETCYAGVWLITHYNDNENVISRFIEITEIPDILKSQPIDISGALQMLTDRLETFDTRLPAETKLS